VPPATSHVLRLPLPVGAAAGLGRRQVDGHFHWVARRHLPAVAQTAMVAPPILHANTNETQPLICTAKLDKTMRNAENLVVHINNA